MDKNNLPLLNVEIQGLICTLVALACVLGKKPKENSQIEERKTKQCHELQGKLDRVKANLGEVEEL